MKKRYFDRYKKIGLKISYYRKLKGFTQEQLAEEIEKHPSFISAIEAPNMYKVLSINTLFDIAIVLDVEPYKFFVDD
ncbi:MAG: helix-turn-helix transcriptional regulator [Clostridia bacterium]|nr:helix-turn-helix transcriptional regulator [Clostridia bacterium]